MANAHELKGLMKFISRDGCPICLRYRIVRRTREKVAERFRYLDNESAGRLRHDDPMAGYDFEWMWREARVLDLRR
ncbi:hypothetical protein [Kushneria aurantia]|uniref:Glutaredoxin n=1 Tax=Kushneria aurantia TaxID=504092 RepID=A0ABV6G3K9_9GAMM|nr:hypothetical protein [Kushneria aurantia]